MGSQIAFEGTNARVEIKKRRESIIEILKEKFPEKEECKEDWRAPIKEALLKEEDMVELKIVKEYFWMKGELYRRMLGGILLRCVGLEEAQIKSKEVHSRTCGFYKEVSSYRRL